MLTALVAIQRDQPGVPLVAAFFATVASFTTVLSIGVVVPGNEAGTLGGLSAGVATGIVGFVLTMPMIVGLQVGYEAESGLREALVVRMPGTTSLRWPLMTLAAGVITSAEVVVASIVGGVVTGLAQSAVAGASLLGTYGELPTNAASAIAASLVLAVVSGAGAAAFRSPLAGLAFTWGGFAAFAAAAGVGHGAVDVVLSALPFVMPYQALVGGGSLGHGIDLTPVHSLVSATLWITAGLWYLRGGATAHAFGVRRRRAPRG